MPKANPVAKLLKQVNSLQIKAEKIASELSEIAISLAALQLEEGVSPIPKPVKEKAQLRKAATKTSGVESTNNVPKKRGRPRKNI